ncbi:hypothetical protein MPSEU_000591100 [Mayamaea pseudoterrestris]|nr:hypothetical protein MPSEU_000591100 [Mayamaea pseudoterrestris]
MNHVWRKSVTATTYSVVAVGIVLTVTPLVLAGVATARRAVMQAKRRRRRRQTPDRLLLAAASEDAITKLDNNDDSKSNNEAITSTTTFGYSGLYAGRVWHARVRPAKHSFSYPMLMFALDLEELDVVLDRLWPLAPVCMRWKEENHLKNGEGMLEQIDADADAAPVDNTIFARVLRLVAQRTDNTFVPTRETHRVVLLTNLCYFGYGFNPVSFYYVMSKRTQSLDAVVAEVSNTPWLEMQCYVLHPASVDNVKVMEEAVTATSVSLGAEIGLDNDETKVNATTRSSVIRYLFPKTFHVSPFMEMQYWYDWTFSQPSQGVNASNDASAVATGSLKKIQITTAMRVKQPDVETGTKTAANATLDDEHDENAAATIGPLHFTANLRLTQRCSLSRDASCYTPLTVIAPTLMTLPIFGILTQVWIHYQAALLYFWKQVPFVPHPNESGDGETNGATRAIAAMVEAMDLMANAWQRVTTNFAMQNFVSAPKPGAVIENSDLAPSPRETDADAGRSTLRLHDQAGD